MLTGLQGVRSLAALSVATSHSWDSPVRDLAWFHGSFLVVDLFFVISGFVVCAAYGRRPLDNNAGFGLLVSRLGRLYPLHIVMLFAFLAVLSAKYGAQWLAFQLGHGGSMTPLSEQPAFFDLEYFLLSLSMLHGVGIVDEDLWNFAAWSISTEIWAFAIVIALFVLTPDRRHRLVLVSLVAMLAAAWFMFRWWDPVGHVFDPHEKLEKLLARAVFAYCIGVLAWEARGVYLARIPTRLLSVLQITLVAVMGYIVTHQPELPFSQLWSVPLWAALIFTIGDDRGVIAVALSTSVLVWLGERSYGIYMAHALVRMGYYHGHKMLTPVDTPLNQGLWLIPYLIATIALAHWLHTRIELPVHNRVKARVKQWQQRRSEAPAASLATAS